MIKKSFILALFSTVAFLAPRVSSVSSASDCGRVSPQSYIVACGINANGQPSGNNPYNDHDADDGYGNYPGNPPTGIPFSLASNNAYCVGQTPAYTISGGTPGVTVNWTSAGPSGQTQTSFQLSSNGAFSGSGNAWQNSDVGQWTKTAGINGASQSLNFTVGSCGTTYNTQPNNNIPASSGNTYYNPYNNNILQPLGNGSSNYMAPGNTYYNPYTDNIFQPLGSPATTINQNSVNSNQSYMAPGNTYYNPYTNDVPCINTQC